jgi:hypothetical protein
MAKPAKTAPASLSDSSSWLLLSASACLALLGSSCSRLRLVPARAWLGPARLLSALLRLAQHGFSQHCFAAGLGSALLGCGPARLGLGLGLVLVLAWSWLVSATALHGSAHIRSCFALLTLDLASLCTALLTFAHIRSHSLTLALAEASAPRPGAASPTNSLSQFNQFAPPVQPIRWV